jgi:rhamnose utilization protein RhaD (predicted bifunctional aldolase and dehydrogenase)
VAEGNLIMSETHGDIGEFEALLALSCLVGSNPLLVQGAGGNTSIKKDGVLWIKASGKWLAHATSEEMMVPVALEPLRAAMRRNDPAAEKAQQFVINAQNPKALRPSIETTVHALFPQRVVVHVHCVQTISIAVRIDGAELVSALLADLGAASIPYARPGLPLARALQNTMNPNTNIAVLGNHGLVVAAETVGEVAELLSNVCAKLSQPMRSAPPPDFSALSILRHDSPYRLPAHIGAHSVATDLNSCRVAAAGSLYPDHVVFLGFGSTVAGPKENAEAVRKRALANSEREPLAILFPGKGILLHSAVNKGADEMALCLSEVTSRIPPRTRLRYLTVQENDELLNWDAEKYRQILNAPQTGGSA